MRKHLARFVKNEDGAAMVEYGLLVGLIAVVSIVAITNLGFDIHQVFCFVDDTIQANLTAIAGLKKGDC